jgi:hypothetical protein
LPATTKYQTASERSVFFIPRLVTNCMADASRMSRIVTRTANPEGRREGRGTHCRPPMSMRHEWLRAAMSVPPLSQVQVASRTSPNPTTKLRIECRLVTPLYHCELAGVTRVELVTRNFADRRSTVWSYTPAKLLSKEVAVPSQVPAVDKWLWTPRAPVLTGCDNERLKRIAAPVSEQVRLIARFRHARGVNNSVERTLWAGVCIYGHR